MDISNIPTSPPPQRKNQLTKGEPVWGNKFDVGVRGVWFQKEKDCFNQNDSLSLSYCFLGPRWLPSDLLWRGQDHGFWREVSLGRPGASSCLLLTSKYTERGRFLTGFLNVNHGGGHSTPPLSLCTFLGLGYSLSEEFPTECTKFQFLRGKKFQTGKNGKKKKKKKSQKTPINLVSGTLEKLQKNT